MRTNIDIDDELMAEAMKVTGAKTKKEAVETALRRLLQIDGQKKILELFGKIDWQGDLDEMRRD